MRSFIFSILVMALLLPSVSQSFPAISEEPVTMDIVDEVIAFESISVDGDDELEDEADLRGWSGNGSAGTPYMIKDINISSLNSYGFTLKNTNSYVLIENISINDPFSSYGLFSFQRSSNITISNITCDARKLVYCDYGTNILFMNINCTDPLSRQLGDILYCDNITFKDSTLTGKLQTAYSQDLLFLNLNYTGPYAEINGVECRRVQVSKSYFRYGRAIYFDKSMEIIFNNNSLDGTRMLNMQRCEDISFRNISWINNEPEGIYIFDCDSVFFDRCDLSGNSCRIEAVDSTNVKMRNNSVSDFDFSGYVLCYITLDLTPDNLRDGKPILFIKDNDMTYIYDYPVYSMMIFYNIFQIRIRNRIVEGAEEPFKAVYCRGLTLDGFNIKNSVVGIYIEECEAVIIENCVFDEISENAIETRGSEDVIIRFCEITADQTNSGIHVFQVEGIQISRSTINITETGNGIELGWSQRARLFDLVIICPYTGVWIDLLTDLRMNNVTIESETCVRFEDTENMVVKECMFRSDSFSVIFDNDNTDIIFNSNVLISKDACMGIFKLDTAELYSNSMIGKGIEFLFRSDESPTLDYRIPPNNTLGGRPVLYMTNSNKQVFSDPNNYGQIIMNGVTEYQMDGFSIENRTSLFSFLFVDYVTLSNITSKNTTDLFRSLFTIRMTISDSTFIDSDNCFLLESWEEQYYDKVVIQNCRIMNCDKFAETMDIDDLRIMECYFKDGQNTLVLKSSSRTVVSDSKFIDVEESSIELIIDSGADVYRNSFLDCDMPLYMIDGSNNRLRENLFVNSTRYAMYIYGGGEYDDWIYSNIFIDNNGATSEYNGENAQVFNWDGDDNFHSPTAHLGNYWSDWLSPDNNKDGIVDEAYPMGTCSNEDDDPLTEFPFRLIGPPSNLTGTVGNGFLVLNWEEPEMNKMDQVTGYRISKTFRNHTEHIDIESDTMSFNDTDIINNEEYSYSISARNVYNESEFSEPIILMGDGESPFFVRGFPERGAYFNSTNITLTWNCMDNNTGVGCVMISIDDGTWIEPDQIGRHTFSNLTDGRHDVLVKALDPTGNEGSLNFMFYIDTAPPEVLINGTEEGFTNLEELMIKWSATDNISGIGHYLVSINGGPWDAYGTKSSYTFYDMFEGEYSISILAYDNVGNCRQFQYSFICDLTSPELEITSPTENELIEGPDVVFRWEATDIGSIVKNIEIRIDDGSWTEINKDLGSYSMEIDNGTHEVIIRITDSAGNSVFRNRTVRVGRIASIESFSPQGEYVPLDSMISINMSKGIDIVFIEISGIEGELKIENTNIEFVPTSTLDAFKVYEVVFRGIDVDGLSFGPYNWTFRTKGYSIVFGIVKDGSGINLSDVKVLIDTGVLFTTEYDGYFSLNLYEGTYTLVFQKDGEILLSKEINVERNSIIDLGIISIDQDTNDSTKEGKEDLDIALILIPIGLILLLIVIVIIFILARKRGSGKIEDEGHDRNDKDLIEEVESRPGVIPDSSFGSEGDLYSDLPMIEEDDNGIPLIDDPIIEYDEDKDYLDDLDDEYE